MIKHFLNYLFQSKAHLLTLLYLLIGTLFFIIHSPSDLYFTIIGNLLLQKTYLCIFLFPACLLFGLYEYRLIHNHTQFIMRLKNRSYYVLLECILIFMTMFLLLLELLLMASSIVVIIYGMNFNLSEIELFIYQFIRTYSCMVILQFMTVTLLMLFKKSMIALSMIFLFIFISFQNVVSTVNTGWNRVLLTRYIFYYQEGITKLSWLKMSLLYYGAILVICLLIQYFFIKKVDFIEER